MYCFDNCFLGWIIFQHTSHCICIPQAHVLPTAGRHTLLFFTGTHETSLQHLMLLHVFWFRQHSLLRFTFPTTGECCGIVSILWNGLVWLSLFWRQQMVDRSSFHYGNMEKGESNNIKQRRRKNEVECVNIDKACSWWTKPEVKWGFSSDTRKLCFTCSTAIMYYLDVFYNT